MQATIHQAVRSLPRRQHALSLKAKNNGNIGSTSSYPLTGSTSTLFYPAFDSTSLTTSSSSFHNHNSKLYSFSSLAKQSSIDAYNRRRVTKRQTLKEKKKSKQQVVLPTTSKRHTTSSSASSSSSRPSHRSKSRKHDRLTSSTISSSSSSSSSSNNHSMKTNHSNTIKTTSGSTATSMMEDWEDEDTRLFETRTSSLVSNNNYNNSNYNYNNRRHHYQTKRLLCQKGIALSNTLEEYRNIWYPSSSTVGSSSSSWLDWRELYQLFHHPPSSIVSWTQIVQSEEVFRTLCTLNHELFVAAMSVLETATTTATTQQQQPPPQKQQQQQYTTNERLSKLSEDTSPPVEDLLCELLAFWEKIRKERSFLVKQTHSLESTKHNHHKQKNNDSSTNNNTNTTTSTSWMDWLLQSAIGSAISRSSTFTSTASLAAVSVPIVVAHEDLAFAPNQYHYSKLVGRLYYHYPTMFHYYQPVVVVSCKNEKDLEMEERSVSDSNAHSLFHSQTTQQQQQAKMKEAKANKIQNLISTSTSPDNLTDKTIRLLVRSYIDIGTIDAMQQAERQYNAYPVHQKNLLWHVLRGYETFVSKENQQYQILLHTKRQQQRRRRRQLSIHPQDDDEDDATTTTNNNNTIGTLAARATKRICELVFAKHASSPSDPSEFKAGSVVAFEALAGMAPFSDKLPGYYEYVRLLGILKFGRNTWVSIIHGNGNHNPKPNTAGSSSSITMTRDDLHPQDYKTIMNLVLIYGKDEQYLDRALQLLEVAFQSFTQQDLKESLNHDIFHTLLRSLIQRQDVRRKKNQINTQNENQNCTDNPELEIAIRLLNKMASQDVCAPVGQTFVYLFRLAGRSGPDADRVRAALETCVDLTNVGHHQGSDDSTTTTSTTHTSSPYPFSPLKAAKYTLHAWARTLEDSQPEVSPKQLDPAEHGWNIIRALRIISKPLLLQNDKVHYGIYDLTAAPDHSTYTLLLQICSRVKSKKSTEVTRKVMDLVVEEGMLMEGSICSALIRAINNSSDVEERIETTKKLYQHALRVEPTMKKSTKRQFDYQFGYFRRAHPSLYEKHLGDLNLKISDSDE